MHSRQHLLLGLPIALVAVVVVSAQSLTPASLMTQDSVNVFRRFSVDRAKVLAFYNDAIGLQPLNGLNMPGGGQMSLFHIGAIWAHLRVWCIQAEFAVLPAFDCDGVLLARWSDINSKPDVITQERA